VRRLWAFLRPALEDVELEREIAAHLALLSHEYRRRGLTEEEAQRAARRALGGVDQTKDRHRDARSVPWLDDLRHDVGPGLRALRKAPGFALAAITTLALGIGATTAIFSVVHALLLKPLPYAARAADLVRLIARTPPPAGSSAPPRRGDVGVPADAARLLGAAVRSLTSVSMVGSTLMSLRGVDGAGHVTVGLVTPEALALLGVAPALGPGFGPGLASATADIALVSHRAWLRYHSC
jgi:hypothetical protein